MIDRAHHPGAARTGADVVIIGAGVVGLATAAALSARAVHTILIAPHLPGEASTAAAGMLAPGAERAQDPSSPAHRFALAARDLYPSYVDALAEVTGARVPLIRNGVLELVADEAAAGERERKLSADDQWVDAASLRTLEPALAPAAGAVLYLHDGAVDNPALVRALQTLVDASGSVDVIDDRAAGIALEGVQPTVRLESGGTVSAGRIVLAAGAWSATIPGVPHTLPVEPVRGQMLSVGTAPLGHVIYGGGGYVVPRGRNLTVVGSTMERVGFETGTTADAIASLERVASRVCPVLGKAPTIDRWSGFRPVTPDLLPILGADPEQPSLIYACGHSRNGILLGPLSGECAAALAVGEDPPVDVSPFAVSRFRSDS